MTHVTTELPLPQISFDNSYARELDGFYVPWQPSPVPGPTLIKLNCALAVELGLDPDALSASTGVAVLAGNVVPDGAQPLAQVYAGHQFGGYSPQLGDGRALLLGEVIDIQGRRRDIGFKGSGRTPFARNGDGKAALGPVLREYLLGEAMHALGIPTTRALAAVSTGERIWRDGDLPGAILTRIAASHVRVGTFEYFAAQSMFTHVQRLADYVIARHDPELNAHESPYLALLRNVMDRQAALVARWMGVGFIHGVMNTDNMTLSGETIDYGPCAFMEAYDSRTVFSSIDRHGRYAYGNQPAIAQWNLTRFAETLLPLLHPSMDAAVALATEAIEAFPISYQRHWRRVLRAKLGLDSDLEGDERLGDDFLELLRDRQVDFTLGFRRLIDAQRGQERLFIELLGEDVAAGEAWLGRWRARLGRSPLSPVDREMLMAQANPIYIPRNHHVEAALAAAVESDDQSLFDRLLAVLLHPFDERPEDQAYLFPASRAQTACYRTFCGT
jgi:serine/tyrosine/threonine adenylyltransferase